ncbi:MAG: ABC transporter permease [Desulfurococcales archaeon]|jgi:ABC-type multidrug transport system permease subunit|nr:ABC transporter permease [Desulfurococcales archaeon]
MPNIVAFRRFAADLLNNVLINFRGLDPWIEMITSPIWALGLVLAIASQSPLVLRDPTVLKDLCWSIVVFIMISDKLWIVGHLLDREKRNGVLENILASRLSLIVHASTMIIVAMLWSLVSLGIILLTIFPILGVNPYPKDPLLAILGYILSDIMAAGIAILYSPLVLILKRPWIITSFFQFTLPLVSGIIPRDIAPPQIASIASINPLSYPVEILRRGATGSIYIDTALSQAIILSMVGIAFLYLLAGILMRVVRISIMKRGI